MTQDFRIETNGATLSGWRREGTGTTLVLVHGFGGSRHDWEPVIAELPADMALIAYDQRGFGESPAVPGKTCSPCSILWTSGKPICAAFRWAAAPFSISR